MPGSSGPVSDVLLISKQKKFLLHCMNLLPQEYEQFDTSRLTILFFCLSGLDVLGVIEEIPLDTRTNIVQWIYSQQKNGEQGVCCPLPGQYPETIQDAFWTTDDIRYMQVYLSRFTNSIPPQHPLYFAKFDLSSKYDQNHFKSIMALLHSIPGPHKTDPPYMGNCLDSTCTDERSIRLAYCTPQLNWTCVKRDTYNFKVKRRKGKDIKWKKVDDLTDTQICLPGQVTQVKQDCHSTDVIARTTNGIYCINQGNATIPYSGQSKHFEMSPHLQNEIAIVAENDDMVISVGDRLTQLSSPDQSLNYVTWTDHPRCLYTVTDSALFVQDCRSSDTISIGCLTLFQCDAASSKIERPETLLFAGCLAETDRKLIGLISSDEHRIFDIRRPGVPILSSPHLLPSPPSFMISSPKFKCNDNILCDCQLVGHRELSRVHMLAMQTSVLDKPLSSVLSYSSEPVIVNGPDNSANWLKVHSDGDHALNAALEKRTKSGLRGIALTSQIKNASGFLRLLDSGDLFYNTIVDSESDINCLNKQKLISAWNNWAEVWEKRAERDMHVCHLQMQKPLKQMIPSLVQVNKEMTERTSDSSRIVWDGVEHGNSLTASESNDSVTQLSHIQQLESENEQNELFQKLNAKWLCISDKYCGFSVSGASTCISGEGQQYFCGHLAATYCALCCLLILGDDLSGVDSLSLLAGLQACQLPNGSFCPIADCCENDMRYVFCAAAISHILNDWRAFDKELALRFIMSSISYDGGIAQQPGLESHGGSIYCALASLHLMGPTYVQRALPFEKRRKLEKWCLMRQSVGFSGRPDKANDSCYTFWIGASQTMLDILPLIGRDQLRTFTLSTQDKFLGGFAKYQDSLPDVLHTYLSLAGLSLLREPGLAKVDATLNISERTSNWLKQIHLKSDSNNKN